MIVIVLRVGSCRNQIPYGRVIYAHKSLFRREFGFYTILRGLNKKGPQERQVTTMELTQLLEAKKDGVNLQVVLFKIIMCYYGRGHRGCSNKNQDRIALTHGTMMMMVSF